ncbi:MAG: hypothetical protein SangKO_068740 [Sandaracinaceae bacterium]
MPQPGKAPQPLERAQARPLEPGRIRPLELERVPERVPGRAQGPQPGAAPQRRHRIEVREQETEPHLPRRAYRRGVSER